MQKEQYLKSNTKLTSNKKPAFQYTKEQLAKIKEFGNNVVESLRKIN
jgi:hypothetical protein